MSDNGGVATPLKAVVDEQQPQPMTVEVVDDKNKSPRHPRWTRQETLTLIEGKKVAEERGRRGRKSSSVLGLDHVEPKWDAVSSYCKQRSVNRGPVQCRKRWSNMVGDFKKIKAWESQVNQECDSYWLIRSDFRKENKLPGFFDKEVFDVLDGKAVTKAAYKLALVTVSANADVSQFRHMNYFSLSLLAKTSSATNHDIQIGCMKLHLSINLCLDKNVHKIGLIPEKKIIILPKENPYIEYLSTKT
ncbi:homeodomain-like, Myb-like domain protein [Artemisia annua]|uniref:Homeodomain-like, Myb-like domain protein n=1 Tax=Artemisia annua TaxID=35608 RepID=A0A2U1M8N4_ARTAN|nr:homeodomain-like, Myb-like domain protein [Artemisia annua]